MTTSLRWGLLVLASLALQIGCCSVHLNYKGPHCGGAPLSIEQECIDDGCLVEQQCKINGLEHIGQSFAKLHHHAAHNLHCSSGCGEVYWDEYINEPPVCDPCGWNNEWVGGCGSCKPWYSRLKNLWGYPYVGPHCSADAHCSADTHCSECSSCAGGTVATGEQHSYPHSHQHLDSFEDSAPPTPMPTEIAPKSKAEPTPLPARPKNGANGVPPSSDGEPAASPDESRNGSGSVNPPKKMVDHHASRQSMEASKRIVSKPASSRRKLTTKSR